MRRIAIRWPGLLHKSPSIPDFKICLRAVRTIIFCWEYGAGLGHITSLRIIAKNFDRNRYRLVLINPNDVSLTDMWPFHSVLDFPDTNALNEMPEEPAQGIISFNATVKRQGFDNPRLMFTRLKLWEKLFTTHSPSLVIGDYAPLALTVARNLNIPSVATGNSYTLPPTNIDAYPKYVNQKDPVSGKELLVSFNQALRLAGMTEISKLPEIFNSDIHSCFTDPQLDLFGKFRTPQAVGPLLKSALPIVQKKRGQKLFVYLTNCKLGARRLVLNSLNALGIPVDIYSLQVDVQDKTFAQGSNISFLDDPISLDRICQDYQLVIHLGGHGLTLELLYAGMPQLLLPIDIEKVLLAQALLNKGLAHAFRIDYSRPIDLLTAKIKEALLDDVILENASSYCARIDRDKWQANQIALMAQIDEIV